MFKINLRVSLTTIRLSIIKKTANAELGSRWESLYAAGRKTNLYDPCGNQHRGSSQKLKTSILPSVTLAEGPWRALSTPSTEMLHIYSHARAKEWNQPRRDSWLNGWRRKAWCFADTKKNEMIGKKMDGTRIHCIEKKLKHQKVHTSHMQNIHLNCEYVSVCVLVC